MPQLVEVGFDSKLTTPSSNRAETEAFLANMPTAFELPNFALPVGYRLLKSRAQSSSDGIIQTLCLIYGEGKSLETIYKVKTLVRNEPNAYLAVKNCTQLLVWRQTAGQHGHILSGFARLVFDYLLQSYTIMISDEQQTVDGKRFWLDRMGESFNIANRKVYYIDLNEVDNDAVPIVESVVSRHDLFEEYIPKGWGNDEAHKNRAFVISAQDI